MSIRAALRDLLVPEPEGSAAGLYASCVTAARRPAFYAVYGVPDTVDGRFDLLLLHVLLVMRRLQDAGVRQELFDLMFVDMDRSLREMGVGDMSIGKKMKPMLAGFYGRAAAYEKALTEAGNDALMQTVSRNLYGMASGTAPHAEAVARYVRASVESLAAEPEDDFAEGRVAFAAID